MLGLTGWKTIVGVLFGAFAVTLPQMKELVDPAVFKWLMIFSSFVGTVLTGLGIAHKIEKGADKIAKNGQAGFTKLPVMMAMAAAFLVVGCIWFGIKPKESTFCQNVPENSYSIICEVFDHFGTTPEAVGLGLQLATITGTDQWYKAEAADTFLDNIQAKVDALRKVGGTWVEISEHLLAQYDLLPKKVQLALKITETYFEYDPDAGAKPRLLTEYDWNRIDFRIADLKSIVAIYKKKE